MVTGASGGIGLEFAERLAKEGYQVTLVARSEPKIKEAAARIGNGSRYLTADLSSAADVARVASDVRASKYDVLINNAGVGVYGKFNAQAIDAQMAMVRLNIESVVALSHAFLSGAKKGDALINVASTLGLLAFPGAAAYCGTKSFITTFSEGLWWENKARGVYVAALLPGVTKTNFHTAAGGTAEHTPPEAISQTAAQVVDVAMRALRSRSAPTIVSGFVNKAMIFFTNRLLPRKAMVNMMGNQSPSAQ
jgi:short-subunit dehydrogenase